MRLSDLSLAEVLRISEMMDVALEARPHFFGSDALNLAAKVDLIAHTMREDAQAAVEVDTPDWAKQTDNEPWGGNE